MSYVMDWNLYVHILWLQIKERILNVDLLALLVMKHFFIVRFSRYDALYLILCYGWGDEACELVCRQCRLKIRRFDILIQSGSMYWCKNGSVYITDYRAGVYALDSKLNLISKMSNIGRGFGEVNRPAKFFVDDNNVITLYNEGLQRYSYFEKDSFWWQIMHL